MRCYFRLLPLLALLLLLPRPAGAQVVTAGPDSVVVAATPPATAALTAEPPGLSHPAKAALWGLIPGGGQVYNRDFWKLPIVYAAFGGITYSIAFNHGRYREFDRAYRLRTDGDAATVDTNPRTAAYGTRDDAVLRGREFFRRNRDLSIIGALAIYGATVVEALVDAHLASFNVSDDLSLRVAPALVPLAAAAPAPGIGLTLQARGGRAAAPRYRKF